MTIRTVRNLTPHAIHLVGEGRSVELLPDGPPARITLAADVEDGHVTVNDLDVPLLRTSSTSVVTDLPDPQDGVLLIVSRVVAEARPDRDDLAYPHLSVRDASGAVIGCRALGRPARSASGRPGQRHTSVEGTDADA